MKFYAAWALLSLIIGLAWSIPSWERGVASGVGNTAGAFLATAISGFLFQALRS